MDRAVRPIVTNHLSDRFRNGRLVPKTSVSAFKRRTATCLFVSDSKYSARITFAAKPKELRTRQTKKLARVMQFRARVSDAISQANSIIEQASLPMRTDYSPVVLLFCLNALFISLVINILAKRPR